VKDVKMFINGIYLSDVLMVTFYQYMYKMPQIY